MIRAPQAKGGLKMCNYSPTDRTPTSKKGPEGFLIQAPSKLATPVTPCKRIFNGIEVATVAKRSRSQTYGQRVTMARRVEESMLVKSVGAQMSSRWCGGEVRRGGTSSYEVHVA
ncbi:hypothetical protein TNCV_2625401 [Trichonephila clavipes]|nr:hypothetical protein TNCV_2625401 [Trichonephila clavipes]